jgi:hypothetical protein
LFSSKTDASATLGFRQYRPSFFPVDLRPQIRNLEVGMEMKSLVMNGERFAAKKLSLEVLALSFVLRW